MRQIKLPFGYNIIITERDSRLKNTCNDVLKNPLSKDYEKEWAKSTLELLK